MKRLVVFVFCFCWVTDLCAQTGYSLQPVSGADGVYQTVTVNGQRVYRSIQRNGQYELYLYFRCAQNIRNRTVYLEVDYLDIGYGSFGVQYNATTGDYYAADTRFDNFVLDSQRQRTAVFELTGADFRNAQNLGADLRLWTDGSLQMHIISASIYLEPTPLFLQYAEDWISPYTGPGYLGDKPVSANTLTGKVICGYQGWFRAAGDPSGEGWRHYVHGDFSDLTVDMWPDMLEHTDAEKYPVPGWRHEDGRQAYLFSSANKRTVLRHFQWMEAYGIDGVAVQRFVSGLNKQHPQESFRIPGYVREAANRTGRTYFIMYDMSGVSPDRSIDLMTDDWAFLVDTMKITQDERYLHHQGKPVVGLFGFFSDRFSAADAHRILDVFQNNGIHGAFLIGSGQWWWRSETAAGWPGVFRRMDGWIPWNVGNYAGSDASTGFWSEDKYKMDASGVLYMPLVYPGFSWDNLQNKAPGTTYFPRRQGAVLWHQLLAARNIGAQAVYVAMFDEIDEGTAIFKVTNDSPVNHYFAGLEGLPSDYYLLMTGHGTKMMRGEVSATSHMPDFAWQSQPSIPDIRSPSHGETIGGNVHIQWTAAVHTEGIDHYVLVIDEQLSNHTQTYADVTLSEGVHAIRVQAVNGLGNSGGWSETVVFEIARRPSGR